MYFFLFIVLFLVMIVYSMFDKLLVLSFELDTNRNDMHLIIYWLYPIFMAKVIMSEYSPQLNVYLFNLRIFSKNMQVKSQQNKSFIQYLELEETYANLYYGLSNPFNTAITTSIIQMIKTFTPDVCIIQYPDFISGEEYIVMQAGSKLNIGKTIIRFVRIKSFQNNMKRSDKHGSTQYG